MSRAHRALLQRARRFRPVLEDERKSTRVQWSACRAGTCECRCKCHAAYCVLEFENDIDGEGRVSTFHRRRPWTGNKYK